MPKKIKLNIFDPSSAIDELLTYRARLELKTKELVSRLADIGMENAKVEFTLAGAENDYGNDTEVRVELTEKGATIIAEGREVLFIEFGAGNYYNAEPSSHPLGAEFGYTIGNYSDAHAGLHPPWSDKDLNGQPIVTMGNPAGRCMYLTGKELRHKLKQIAKEVFVS